MKVFKDDSYGADIDGNRGTTVYEYELEKSDRDYIVECIMEQYEPDETRYTVTFDNPYTGEDIDIEVDIYEWLSDDEIKEHRRKEYLEALRVAYIE